MNDRVNDAPIMRTREELDRAQGALRQARDALEYAYESSRVAEAAMISDALITIDAALSLPQRNKGKVEMNDIDRYFAAAHAMQTGVKLDHERGSDDGTPKHLRVGINSGAVDHVGLVRLLISKGIITEAEYTKAIADEMEEEVARYRDRLRLPPNVSLG